MHVPHRQSTQQIDCALMNTYRIKEYPRHTLGQKRLSSVAVKLTKEKQKEALNKYVSAFELSKYNYICVISYILHISLQMPEGLNMKWMKFYICPCKKPWM